MAAMMEIDMRNLLFAAFGLSLLAAGPAVADEGRARAEAIQACRAAVSAEAGDQASVKVNETYMRGRAVKLRLAVGGEDGQRRRADCVVSRRTGEFEELAFTPKLIAETRTAAAD